MERPKNDRLKNTSKVYESASEFWNKYSQRKDLSEHSLMNLNPDPDHAYQKFVFETKDLVSWWILKENWSVLDLGGGVGYWSTFFLETCASVTLVEREAAFIEITKNELDPAIEYSSKMTVLIIRPMKIPMTLYLCLGYRFTSMIFTLRRCMANMKKYLKSSGIFIHRDAFGVDEQFNLVEKYSENLQEVYTAKYRTRPEYDGIFIDEFGMKKLIDVDMYDVDAVKRRWKETRFTNCCLFGG